LCQFDARNQVKSCAVTGLNDSGISVAPQQRRLALLDSISVRAAPARRSTGQHERALVAHRKVRFPLADVVRSSVEFASLNS
jgi:hypothetical protein